MRKSEQRVVITHSEHSLQARNYIKHDIHTISLSAQTVLSQISLPLVERRSEDVDLEKRIIPGANDICLEILEGQS